MNCLYFQIELFMKAHAHNIFETTKSSHMYFANLQQLRLTIIVKHREASQGADSRTQTRVYDKGTLQIIANRMNLFNELFNE